MSAGKQVRLIDVTLRDAHQCLWATRMTTAMMSGLAPLLDRAGFEAIDLEGGAVFDVCVRYLREDPWERMRIVSSWVKETPLIIMTRGQSLFTFEFFPDDIVALTAERIFANGIRYHTPYDALNDIRNMEVPVRAAKQVGLYVDAGVVYTISPVHTDDYYVRKIKELVALGADAIFLEVAEDNPGAIALYRSTGFETVGRRPDYYPRKSRPPVAALIMRHTVKKSDS